MPVSVNSEWPRQVGEAGRSVGDRNLDHPIPLAAGKEAQGRVGGADAATVAQIEACAMQGAHDRAAANAPAR